MFNKDTSTQYEQFKPIVMDVENQARFIGEGAESRVFSTELSFGKYAIKIAKENALNPRGRVMDRGLMTKSKIDSGIKGLGIYGLEQFTAGSTEDFAAIYQIADGAQLSRIDASSVELITSDQKEKFNQTVIDATEAGLAFDARNPSGANAFYSPENGFTLIDYKEAYWPLTYKENWSAALRSLGPIALRAFTK